MSFLLGKNVSLSAEVFLEVPRALERFTRRTFHAECSSTYKKYAKSQGEILVKIVYLVINVITSERTISE